MYLFVATFVVLFVLGITCIITNIYLGKKNNEGQKMVMGNNFLWLTGFGCGILFMAIGIFAYIQEGGAFESYLFLIFVWLSMSLMYGWFGMITLYDEDGFTQGWLPLQKKRYTYEQLTGYKITLKGYKLYVGKKCISFDDSVMMYYFNFVDYAAKRYKNISGKKLPMDRSIPKWDIFKGHLEAPEEFIFLIIMMLTIGFGILGWHVYEIKDDTTIEETTRVRVVIEDYYTDDNHLILESKVPECKFDISLYKNYDDEIQQVLKEISNENPLYIYAVKYKETNSGKRKFEVAGIENSEGEDIISFEKMNEVQKEYDESFLPFGIIICIICVLFSLTIWLVGRYPHKFSKRIQQAIFQDGYLH